MKRSLWLISMRPQSNDRSLTGNRRGEDEYTRGAGHVKMEAEVGAMKPYASCPQVLKETEKGSPAKSPTEDRLCGTPSFQLPEL